jgi:hypothetical protein
VSCRSDDDDDEEEIDVARPQRKTNSVEAVLIVKKLVAVYPAKRMKEQSRPGDRDCFPPTIHLQSQIKMRKAAMPMVEATMSLVAPTPSRTRKVRCPVPLSGNGRPCLALAQRRRSASTIFSRDLPAKVEHSPNPVGTLQSHIPLLTTIGGSLQSLMPKIDCLRQLLRHEPWIRRYHLIAATLADHQVICYRR